MWKKCKYCNSYEISTNGEVRNIFSQKILKPYINKYGYAEVSISLGKKHLKKNYRVHRLVAETFIPNPNNLPQVNHKDGNKLNNKIYNLEWVTNEENILHSIQTGLKPNEHGEYSHNSKLTNKQANWCRHVYIPKDKKYGCVALAKHFGVAKSTMSYILNNKTYI